MQHLGLVVLAIAFVVSCGNSSGSPGDPSDGAATSDANDPIVGDRYVAATGSDGGDCSDAGSPCKTFAYAGGQMQSGEVLVVGDGTYPDAVSVNTFPRGTAGDFTAIAAEHPGAVTVTGGLTLFENSEFYLEVSGFVFSDAAAKSVAGGNVRLRRVSFVGGPATGNTMSFAVGTNNWSPGAWDILCEDCLFYGLGGRYAALVYRSERVTFRRIVARKDGGWGLGSSSATDFEPEGVVNFYESSDSTCEHCIVLDSLKLSHSSAEGLGGLIVTSHDSALATNVELEGCVVIDNAYSGISWSGNGQINQGHEIDSYSIGNTGNGTTIQLATGGDVTVTRATLRNNQEDGIADYSKGPTVVTVVDSMITGNAGEQLRGVTGSGSGAGAAAIDLSGFDGPRIRSELCATATRGLCAGTATFADYVLSRLSRLSR